MRLIAGSHRRAQRSRQSAQSADFPWRHIIIWVAAFAVVGLALSRWLDVETVHDYAAGINGGLAFALLVVLPLLGFPASVLHIVAGMRFGAPLGLALVSLSIVLQLLASYALVHFWRARFEHAGWIGRLRQRIPHGAHASVT